MKQYGSHSLRSLLGMPFLEIVQSVYVDQREFGYIAELRGLAHLALVGMRVLQARCSSSQWGLHTSRSYFLHLKNDCAKNEVIIGEFLNNVESGKVPFLGVSDWARKQT